MPARRSDCQDTEGCNGPGCPEEVAKPRLEHLVQGGNKSRAHGRFGNMMDALTNTAKRTQLAGVHERPL